MNAAELPPIEGLVPPRGESLLLDCVLELDDESTVARVVVGSRKTAADPRLRAISPLPLACVFIDRASKPASVFGFGPDARVVGWGSACSPTSARFTKKVKVWKEGCWSREG